MSDALRRDSDWTAVHVCVAGVGVAGFAAADALLRLGAAVTVIDAADGPRQRERASVLEVVGARVLLGDSAFHVPAETDLLVVSPGLRPDAPVIREAAGSGIPVWGELELAWRLRGPSPAAWLCVTGTNGKTTTTLMLDSMLRAAGLRSVAAGNIGVSVVDVVMHDELDVIALEVGAPQLPFVQSMSPFAAVCLNVADDHIDHFGTFPAYVDAKARVFARTQVAAVYNAGDARTRQMVEDADVIDGCRAIAFRLGAPDVSMLGVVEGVLVDRAFVDDRMSTAQELATLDDVRPPAPHNVANALAAAALARAFGVPAAAVREGLRTYQPAPHRIATVAVVDDVTYVDDSKATNAHAALTSLRAYPSVVWIAGGMAKGQEFDELVLSIRDRLRAVVLLGVDRAVIVEALRRHAPDVPVIEVASTDTGAMLEVVRHAARVAVAGDTVLLAPGCASWDMFRDYADRGTQFADAASGLGEERDQR